LRGRRRKPIPPTPKGAVGIPQPKGILELDRFTESSVEKWNEISADLDELNDVLHFNLEPERRRRRPQLLDALRQINPVEFELENWVRIVDFQWSLEPLSAAGSLTYIGGRYNAGQDLDRNTLEPWPTLYIAEDYQTAYREKFQISADHSVDGLSAEELALDPGKSHSTVFLKGKLSRIFEISPQNLGPVAQILGRIKMPERAEKIKKKLKIQPQDLRMVTSGKQLYEIMVVHNWRILPVQFGLPSPTQILSELIKAAGFEGIAYPSSKNGGRCLAVFVDSLATGSFVEIKDSAPKGVISRLDDSTADVLSGWKQIGLASPVR